MSDEKKRKRRFGSRRNAHRVKAPGLQTVMGYLLPKRTECECYLHDEIDVTKVMQYIEKKNLEHPDYKTTIFHCAIFSMAKMVRERPKLNRFIQSYRLYERDDISISFVIKRRFQDHGEESLMVVVPKEDDTLDSISRQIVENITETRKSEHATGGIDSTLDAFMKIPFPILALTIRIIRLLDFWGINPRFLTDGDPNYTTILTSNLGSIKAPAVYHHLNNYGTNSIMVTIGTLHDAEVKEDDGTVSKRKMIDIGATVDERIADGFYFARSLNLIKYIFAHPELLDQPLSEPSGYQYE